MTVFEAITQSPEALAKQINLMFYCDPQKELSFAEWLKTNCDDESWKPWRDDLATGWDIDRLRELMAADREGRIRIIPPPEDGTCGTCGHFHLIDGKCSGTCDVRKEYKDRYGRHLNGTGRFTPSRSRKACKRFVKRGEGGECR